MTSSRIETDGLGQVEVPADKLSERRSSARSLRRNIVWRAELKSLP
jgi:fumarate hydratase class II